MSRSFQAEPFAASAPSGYLALGGGRVGAGLLVAAIVAGHAAKPVPAPPAVAPVPVRDVLPGEVLSRELLTSSPVPVHPGPGASDALIGRVVAERLLAGEPVREERLAPPSAGLGVPALVPRGMRGVAVAVGSVSGVAPGDWVDVAETLDRPGAEAETRLLGLSTRVLAVDAPTRTVLLAVTPAQAQALGRPAPRVLAFGSPIDATRVEVNGRIVVESAPSPAQGAPSVALARRDLAPGLAIGAQDLVAVAAVPGEVGLTLEDAIGRIPRERILAAEVVRDERLADPARGYGLAAIVPRGMVGVPLPVPAGAWVQPGSYVDVVVSFSDRRATMTLLQAVFVMAEGPDGVVLLATRDQAEALAHVVGVHGDVTLALRNDLDVTFAPLEPLGWDPPPSP